ncbi:MAG: class I SAM-dependent methyltransferase [Alphaproteobacteria bacterium]|nr:class I SAM-dependent methyltransferase [Alphaproteobacteria bacterium]
MQDPVRRHPTRAEQLDLLVSIVAEQAVDGDRLLDLGCGQGYLAHLLLARHAGLVYVGADRSTAALDQARANLAPQVDRVRLVPADLDVIDAAGLPVGPYRFIVAALVFHDLSHAAKARVIGWAARQLTRDGFFLLYDRIRLAESALFPLQRAIWRRLQRLHGEAMREAADFVAYQADLGPDNNPARLVDYAEWFRAAGLAGGLLHLHGNVALIAGAPAT